MRPVKNSQMQVATVRGQRMRVLVTGHLVISGPFLMRAGSSWPIGMRGFWRAMDTLRDRQMLEEMVERGEMPWRLHSHDSAGVSS